MLAADYDATIATRGRITDKVEKALLEAKQAGYLISIVTGRGFDDLLRICPHIKIFGLVVAENGAILYFPFQDKIEKKNRRVRRVRREKKEREIY